MDSSTKTKIYCLTHKDFTPPSDEIYVPLSVFEDSGKNIADKNCYYSELTGCYWAWKNSDADYIGICHYRRYLLNEEGSFFTKEQIAEILKEYDLITTKVLTLNFPYEYGFSKNHKPYYLEELHKLIRDDYPEILSTYETLVGGVNTLFGNMLICKRGLFDAYHSWLFDILFNLESRIVIDEPDSYHRRIFGFISEFLLYVYVVYNGLKVKHTMVGMVGEKTEVKDIKKKLWEYLKLGDWSTAKEYFLLEHKKRPDILMEASDIGWELHYCMEAIAIAEHESFNNKPVFLKDINSYKELISFLRNLNKCIEKNDFKDNYLYSDEAIYVAKTLFEAKINK